MKPRLLDLFCGAGGAAMGYHRAGFEVVGVDIEPQPNYPFPFVQMGALEFLDMLLGGQPMLRSVPALAAFAAVHASPPCQAHVKGLGAVNAKLGRESTHQDLIPQTRELLIELGLPYIIENVEGAPLRNAIKLCGSSFGLPLQRHRLFESNVPILALPCAHHLNTERRYWTPVSAHRGADRRTSTVVQVYGNGGGAAEWPAAMGIDWMTTKELTQAIPPAYTEYLGGYLTAVLRTRGEPPQPAGEPGSVAA